MTELIPEQNDFFLQQLQKRLIFLATLDKGKDFYTDNELSALRHLIALLYNAPNHHNGVVSVEQITGNIGDLINTFPNLLSHAEDNRPTPIIVFADLIAFRRDWQQLNETADYLRNSVTKQKNISFPTDSLSVIHWKLANGYPLSDEQKLAAISAAVLPFCVITGGAGTGKTTTLAKALELCLLDNPNCQIAIAAPTGKAAHRLNESLAKQMDSIHLSVREKLQQLHATTLHRLLGISEQSGRPFHNAKNPLACDVLVIDEASMVGGDLFTDIRQALLPDARIILLGDANQLPAINSTAFFAEISRLPIGYSEHFCELVNPYLTDKITAKHSPLPNTICRLSVSQRFAEKSLIEQASDAVLTRESNKLIDLLGENFISLSVVGKHFIQQLADNYPTEKSALQTALNQHIILCANRQGIFGTAFINRYLDDKFRHLLGKPQSQWYAGRRILIEQNDYQLGIHNGDIGSCQWSDNGWQIVFDDGRTLPVEQLLTEKYSLAFAITIHKSQGSEYAHVDIVLDTFDAQNPNPLINQSLLYTAITRAKHHVRLYTDAELVDFALQRTDIGLSPLSTLFSHPI